MPRKKKAKPVQDLCIVKKCDRFARHKRGKYVGLCHAHLDQMRKGKALEDMKPLRKAAEREQVPMLDRFFTKVQKTDTCWLWTGTIVNGYGCVSVDGRSRRAHRVAYELLVGPTDQALVLHHKCGVRACVNPDHLQEITYHENTAEMLERTGYIKRIKELEAELARMRSQLGSENDRT